MTRQNKAKNKKLKIRPLAAALTAGAVLFFLLVAAFFAFARNGNQDAADGADIRLNTVDVKPTEVSGQNDGQPAATVEIQLEDYAVVVGTRFKVTAVVTPMDTEQALIWNSSNTDVFEVDADGQVSVHGVGTAVLTATVGTVTDAVVIEGITTAAEGSKNNLPVYTSGSQTMANDASETDGTGGQGNVSAGGRTDGENSFGGGSAEPGGSSDNNGGDGGDNGSGGTSSGMESGGSESGGNSGNGSNGGADSSQIAGVLPELGFTPVMSNVYVCREEDTYHGEIITQPNVTIIYIKLRSTVFDIKIQSVLAALLPAEHQQVWNNYLAAGTDRTFTAENRRVRIVVAVNGGHSQIVIYN